MAATVVAPPKTQTPFKLDYYIDMSLETLVKAILYYFNYLKLTVYLHISKYETSVVKMLESFS